MIDFDKALEIFEDIIKNSTGKDSISMSDDIYQAISDLKDFNYKHIYDLANTPEEKEYIKEMFNVVADGVLEQLKKNDLESDIYKSFLNNMNPDYIENTTPERKVIDFIAGMTDDYFQKEYHKIKKLTK